MELWPDEQLIDEYQKTKNADCISELYRRYQLLILGLCYQILEDSQASEDLLNEVFLKLITLPDSAKIKHVRNWLYTTAKHLSIDRKRKRKTYQRTINEAKSSIDSVRESAPLPYPEETPEQRKLNQLLSALNQLPGHQRLCLELFYLKEKSYQEIQELTGMPFKQIKSYIQNGKRRLRLNLIKN